MNWLHRLFIRRASNNAIKGGLSLPRNKPGLPADQNIPSLQVPDEIVIPLLNYHREALSPRVRIGQRVEVGDSLAKDIISPARGTVTQIEHRPIIHPSLRTEQCVIIRTDSTQISTQAIFPTIDEWNFERLSLCAVQGLGGAGFATAKKLQAALRIARTTEQQEHKPEHKHKHKLRHEQQYESGQVTGPGQSPAVHTLIVNAVECEPGISCDEALIMSEAESVVEAVLGIIELGHYDRCILAIENDKNVAISELQEAIGRRNSIKHHLELCKLAPVYPSGAERPLVEHLTGISLDDGRRAYEHGIACINVATALSIWRAYSGYPLISRVITIGGQQAINPVNVRVLFGTSVRDVLDQTGNAHNIDQLRVRAGGPLSGFDLDSLDVPVTATTNCIAVEAPVDIPISLPCIRCSACSDVCPVDLLPQQLYWYASNDDLIKSRHYGLNQCIECGCCDVVCPSHIPLTQTFRYARNIQHEQLRLKRVAQASKERYQQREIRMTQRAAAREQRRQLAKVKLEQSTDPIAAALARARKRRKRTDESDTSGNSQ